MTLIFITAKCIDTYTAKRKAGEAARRRTADGIPADPEAAAADPKAFEVDPRQEGIVNRMFQRCFDEGEFKQALGIAVETNRMDMFKEAILQSGVSWKTLLRNVFLSRESYIFYCMPLSLVLIEF